MLKLPLHCYDEAGNILPPKWLNYLLIAACIDYVVFIFAVASMQYTSELLSFFYPDRRQLTSNLIVSFPLLLVLVFVSQRERLWKHRKQRWMAGLKPLMLSGFILTGVMQLQVLLAHHWQFHAYMVSKLMLSALGIYIVMRSRHLRWMLADWQAHAVKQYQEEKPKD